MYGTRDSGRDADPLVEWLIAAVEALPVAVAVARDARCESIVMNRAGRLAFDVARDQNISPSQRPEYRIAPFRHFLDGCEIPAHAFPLQTAVRENRAVGPIDVLIEGWDNRLVAGQIVAVPLRNGAGEVCGGTAAVANLTIDMERGGDAATDVSAKLTDWTWVADGNGALLFRGGALTGGGVPDDGPSLGIADLLEPADRQRFRAEFSAAIAAGHAACDIDCRLACSDDRVRWVRTRAVPLRGLDGRIVRWYGTVVPIGPTDTLDAAPPHDDVVALTRVFDQFPVGVFVASDPQCTTMWANAAVHRMLGTTPHVNMSKSAPADEVPQGFRALRNGIEIPAAELPLQRAVFGNQIVHGCAFDIERADGVVLHLVADARPLYDRNGAVRGGICTMAQSSNAPAARFASLVNANVVGVLVASMRGGKILDANDEFLRMVGYTRDDLTSGAVDWRAMTPPEWQAADAVAIAEIIERGACTPFEKEYYRKDGSRVPFLIGVALIDAAADEVICYTVDRTAEKAARRALEDSHAVVKESERHFRAFADAIPVIAWTATSDGWIDWYNRRWYDYTGLSADDSAGWGWQSAHHPDDFPHVMERWSRSIAGGEPLEMEYRLRAADGGFRWFLSRIVPLRDEHGHIVRWYGSSVDIEEQTNAMQRSTRIAKALQEAFLPAKLPPIENARLDALYLPAEHDAFVGGDWYDAVRLPDGRLFVSCGDVAGHGLDAAVASGIYRQALSFAAMERPDPADVLERVNQLALAQSHPIASAAVAVFDPAALTLRYALAGHPPLVVAHRNASAHVLDCDGLPLGVFDDIQTRTHTLQLETGDVIVLFTDGITEHDRDVAGGELALVLAARVIASHPAPVDPARAIKRAVMGDKAPSDDAVIVVLQCMTAPDGNQAAGAQPR